MIRNKARLVAQRHIQEEELDYDEVFTPVVRIEEIRLFLAYVSFKDCVVYQMDVKSAFLYGMIVEEVYVCQPPGFEDPDFPDRVYKVEKHYIYYIKLLKHEHVADEAIYKELDDRLVRATTTASSLEAEQDSGNINKTQSKVTPNEDNSLGTTSGGGLRCQDNIGDTIAQTRVLSMEKIKTTQAPEITSLKRRVKKLEKKQRIRTHRLKRLYKVGLTAKVDSSEDEQILVDDQDDAKMFDVNDLHGEEVFFKKEVADKEVNDEVQKVVEEVVKDITTAKIIVDVAQVNAVGEVNAASITTTVSAAATITTEEVTLAKALAELKASQPKQKVDDEKEIAEFEKLIEINLNEEEVAIDAIPLAVKSPKIID
nr:putative ribonuclease H-like domain-containing protein [Tanacetum cinerariifolium]